MSYSTDIPGNLQSTEAAAWEATQNGDFNRAAQLYKECTEIEQDNPRTWFGWGVALGNLGNYDEAVIRFTIAHHYDRTNHAPLYNEAFYRVQLGEYRTAKRLLTKAIPLAEHNSKSSIDMKSYIYYLRGYSELRLEEFEEALTDYNQALTLNPLHAAAHFERGLILFRRNQIENAIKDFQFAANSDYPEAREWLQKAQRELHREFR